jgi:hypothetical protein
MSEVRSALLLSSLATAGRLFVASLPQTPSPLLILRLNRGIHRFGDFLLPPAFRHTPQTKVGRGEAAMRFRVLRRILD